MRAQHAGWRVGVMTAALACAQAFASAQWPRDWQQQTSLGAPPSVALARIASLGEPIAAGYALTLYTQAFDAQAGKALRLAELDPAAIRQWLDRALDLDPATGHPLLLAARVYAEVFPREEAIRMIGMVNRRFLEDPQSRWRWLAHSVHVARHVLDDQLLALELARSLRLHANGPGVPAWVRHAEPLLLADMGRAESARVLLGALFEGGSTIDPAEIAFLTARLSELEPTGTDADTRAVNSPSGPASSNNLGTVRQ